MLGPIKDYKESYVYIFCRGGIHSGHAVTVNTASEPIVVLSKLHIVAHALSEVIIFTSSCLGTFVAENYYKCATTGYQVQYILVTKNISTQRLQKITINVQPQVTKFSICFSYKE